MKKYIKLFFVLILLVSCNENVTNLNDIIHEKRIQILLNEYVDNVISKKDNGNIFVTGTVGDDHNILEIGLYNQKPVLYEDKDAKYLNSYIESKKIGFFKYKNVNFYVTDDLKNIFKLEYMDFDKIKNEFDTKDMPEPTDHYNMYINVNKKDSSIFYYSNLSKESLKWKEIK